MKKRKKLNANKLMGILFFSLLLVLGTCFFLKSDFFYLKYIEINNNKYLTKEDVLDVWHCGIFGCGTSELVC